MIKIGGHIYIHVLTVAMFAIAYVTRTLGGTAAVYGVMLLHELAHTAAAAWLGLGICRITLYPFGVNLRVQSRMIATVWEEIILYLAGPLVNITAALLCGIFCGRNLFYYNNIILFAVNMLPVLPLDGGQIAGRLLSEKFGMQKADMILKAAAAVIFAAMAGGIIYLGGVSVNSGLFCAFLFAAIFTQKPKYSRDFVKELAMGGKCRNIRRAEVFFAPEDCRMRKVAAKFNPSKGALVILTDEENNIEKMLTKEQVIESIMSGKRI